MVFTAMEDPEFDNDHDEFDEPDHLEMLTPEEATKERQDLDYALLMEAVAPALKET